MTDLPPNPPARAAVAPAIKPRGETRYYEMVDNYDSGRPDPDFADLDTLRRSVDDEQGSLNGDLGVVVPEVVDGLAARAEVDQWFDPDGYLTLATSQPLPADLMARAVAAAYLVLREAAFEGHGRA